MPLPGKTPVLRTGKTILSTKNNDNQEIGYKILAGLPKYKITLSLVVLVVFYNSLRTRHASIGFSTQRVGFFHDEIEIPERVTISVIRLSGSLLTSRIISDSVKNSIEFLSQKWGFYGFC